MQFIENEVKEVGRGVWIRVAIDNVSWCDLGESAAVIDALEDATQASVVRDLIRQTTGKELKYVVSTHWDVDHIACNPQWKREGATIIAHQSCMDSAGDWEGRPDISYPDNALLKGASEEIQMQWLGGTHTPWDTVLYFPHAKVLHIADLFGWGLIPCRPTPEKIARLREVLSRVLEYDAQAVICGHGPVCTLQHIARFVSYLNDMMERVPALAREGKSQDEIAGSIPPPADMEDWWRFSAWKHAKNIEMICEDAS